MRGFAASSVESIPIGSTGKFVKRELREQFKDYKLLEVYYQVALKKFHLFKAEWSEKTRIPGCCNGFPSRFFFRGGK